MRVWPDNCTHRNSGHAVRLSIAVLNGLFSPERWDKVSVRVYAAALTARRVRCAMALHSGELKHGQDENGRRKHDQIRIGKAAKVEQAGGSQEPPLVQILNAVYSGLAAINAQLASRHLWY